MKRIISYILSVVIILVSISSTLLTSAAQVPNIYFDDVSAQQGDNVLLDLCIENNTGIAGLVVSLKYDTDVLTLTSTENGTLFSGFTASRNFAWDHSENVTQDGVLASFSFDVSETAPDGKYEIEIVVRSCINEHLDDVAYSVTDGSISVEEDVPITPVDMSIYTNPGKLTYYIGDSLNTSGLKLKLEYNNGSYEYVTTGFTTSGFSSTTSGTKTITVSYQGFTDTFTVTVRTPSISLSSSSLAMDIGDTQTITASTDPGSQTVNWTSSSTSVATVLGGRITAKGAGTTTITAKFTYNGRTYSKTCTVNVNVNTYTISYHANGGSRAPVGQTKTHGTNITLSSDTPKRFGYNFVGWATSSTATTATYQPGDTYTSNSSITLYAVWETYTVYADSDYYADIDYKGQCAYFVFTPTESGKYVIYSTSGSDTVVILLSSSGDYLSGDNNSGSSNNFKLEYVFTAGTEYVFEIAFYSSLQTGSIPFTIEYIPEIVADSYNEAYIDRGGKVKRYTFTPTVSGDYVIYSTSGSNTYVRLYESDGSYLASNDNSGDGYNFRLKYDLTAGTEYIFEISYYSSYTTGTIPFYFEYIPVVVEDVYINNYPYKTVYNVDEYLDTSGLELYVEYSDGSYEYITTGFTISGFDSSTAGIKTVTVSYQGFTDTFTVTVEPNDELITLYADSYNEAYINREDEIKRYTFTPTVSGKYVIYSTSGSDTVVNLYESDGLYLASDDDGGEGRDFRLEYSLIAGEEYIFEIAFYNSSKTGKIPFVFEYAPVVIENMYIYDEPDKTGYYLGEQLDTTGLKLKVEYSDGSYEYVTSGFEISGFNSSTVGIKTVTVSYQGFTDTFTVEVYGIWKISVNLTGVYTFEPDTPIYGFNQSMISVYDKQGKEVLYNQAKRGWPLVKGLQYVLKINQPLEDMQYVSYWRTYTAVLTIFPDTSASGWYNDAVTYAVGAGIMSGYSNGKFGTSDSIQRQDFLVMLARLDGVNLGNYKYKSSFPDVARNSYYEAAVNWGSRNGIVTGYQNGKFGVGDKVTREQLVTFLYRYAKYKGYDYSYTADRVRVVSGQYEDYKSVSTFAKGPILWAIEKGVISGKTSTTIAPQGNAQRCEVAKIMYNIFLNDIFK